VIGSADTSDAVLLEVFKMLLTNNNIFSVPGQANDGDPIDHGDSIVEPLFSNQVSPINPVTLDDSTTIPFEGLLISDATIGQGPGINIFDSNMPDFLSSGYPGFGNSIAGSDWANFTGHTPTPPSEFPTSSEQQLIDSRYPPDLPPPDLLIHL